MNENENITFQNLWDTAKAVLKEVENHTTLSQKIRKISNNLNLYLKELEKEEQTEFKV